MKRWNPKWFGRVSWSLHRAVQTEDKLQLWNVRGWSWSANVTFSYADIPGIFKGHLPVHVLRQAKHFKAKSYPPSSVSFASQTTTAVGFRAKLEWRNTAFWHCEKNLFKAAMCNNSMIFFFFCFFPPLVLVCLSLMSNKGHMSLNFKQKYLL